MSPTPSWVKQLKPSGPQGHELLKQEREKSDIPVKQLSEFLYGKEQLERTNNVLKILKTEPVFDKSQNYFAGRVDRFETALARAKRLQQVRVKKQWTDEEFLTANDLISEPGPYGLHEGMFLVRHHVHLSRPKLTKSDNRSRSRYSRATQGVP
jgi:acyl-CoA oxidase